ncbi:hypothetical protein NC653_030077 [Populus alba x Populus x berolinensis]|uniref:Uncharacterized protein n=1 Tax=Populus alba x Populus x berolinensis TaxID=444605 RepID=A0AAD6Q014_9ROSI|nr:hypothetical protein NC653_030077 [Populus alba x Populus x berolinensis]
MLVQSCCWKRYHRGCYWTEVVMLLELKEEVVLLVGHDADEKEEASELDEMLLEYGGQLTVQLNKKDTVVLREADVLRRCCWFFPQTAELEVVELAAVAALGYCCCEDEEIERAGMEENCNGGWRGGSWRSCFADGGSVKGNTYTMPVDSLP